MVSIASLKDRLLDFQSRLRPRKEFTPLYIPTLEESSSEFTSRAYDLLTQSTTKVYIDTSFLMWMTKIGDHSRDQFLRWLAATCPGNVCVPVWSAHEYLRHHTSGTVLDELSGRIKEMAEVAGKSYTYLRPFLDTQFDQGTSLDSQQAAARHALNELQKLAQTAKQWNKHYKLHANKVIEFVNAHVSKRTDVFSMLDGIQALGGDRFDGRVPPGFQDRGKKNRAEMTSSTDEEVEIGSNRCGDLIFWKEVLTLSAIGRVKNIVLLTNDMKNDWQLGGRNTPDERELRNLKGKWRPLPFTHPMLSLEASIESNVQQVVLLDSVYLGLLLKRHGNEDVKEFVDVAIVPDPPTLLTDRQQRKEKIRGAQKESTEKQKIGEELNTAPLFEDSPGIQDSVFALKRAWLNSKKPTPDSSPAASLLKLLEQTILSGHSVADVMTKEHLGKLDTDMLVYLGRQIHTNCLSGSLGSSEAITDVIGILSSLPQKTASNLYLGILGSMYFEIKNNDTRPRIPPRSPAQELIIEQQSSVFASAPTKVIKDAFRNIDTLPLYLPNTEAPSLDIELDHVPDADGELILGSIKFADVELFSEAQKENTLNLRTLFGGRDMLTALEIIEATCKCFVIPFKQMQYSGNANTQFQITPTAGFRNPKQALLVNTR